jgi:hypothetical protein
MEVSGQIHYPATLTSGERVPGTRWIGDWVGPTADLDAVVNIKNSCPYKESNCGRPTLSLVIIGNRYIANMCSSIVIGSSA